MEYFDILDNQGNLTGTTATREDSHLQGLWHRIVHIWIINSRGQILIQKRTPNKDTYPNMWGMSCEGHISAGQTSQAGALRELKEELDLQIKPEQLEPVFTYQRSAKIGSQYIGNHFIDVYLVKLDVETSKLKIQEDEVSEVKWLDLNSYLNAVLDGNKGFRDYPGELEKLPKMINDYY